MEGKKVRSKRVAASITVLYDIAKLIKVTVNK